MGNASSSNSRERHKSGDSLPPCSPGKIDGNAFTFDRKPPNRIQIAQQHSNDDEAPFFTKPSPTSSHPQDPEFQMETRQRSATVSEGSNHNKGKKTLPTVFKWEGGGKQVYVSGTFSNWKTLPMVKSQGDFVTIVDLPEGEHEYKFLVDGEWKHDSGKTITTNSKEGKEGSKTNLVYVKHSDFEVFEALAIDSEASESHTQSEYSQDIPVNKPWEKVPSPPVLPPHLLQVILNKDTPLSCEPTLLPEPNHVMLNHLYALSIKDGVMVLSATHRYRKKYVTTLLYKPI
ncbi:5'-AMP-activated protein kinase subunit beta-1 isoform X2 [Cloeon dipterum]|uniref:5'-AMP-activated protein kinase subunit beta-1 isoform X2 n=1 Tax=Cloeon dipterum TaxID=197152 RepID=UPI00321F6B1D